MEFYRREVALVLLRALTPEAGRGSAKEVVVSRGPHTPAADGRRAVEEP
jgi:hypothetical protein